MSPSTHPISRRRLLVTTGVTGAAAAAGLLRPGTARANAGPQSYTATWASVDQHPPAPEWFQDAKFGIYYHWGVFSVPAFGNEWYPRRMFDSSDICYTHHVATYGDPYTTWPYQNFMLGANDKAGNFTKFQPKLVSDGGNWDPDAWAQLFADAGARFAGPVAEHHDGYSMWNSKVNEWNSVKTGPGLDLLRIHSHAIRSKGLKFMCSLHHAYHFLGYYQFVPPQTTSTLRKLYGQQGTAAENLLWYNKLAEVINGYQPDMIWQDFDLSNVEESYRLQFLADYYNAAVAWNKDVVATYKDGFDKLGEVYDFERGGAGGILTPYWLTDDAVSPSTWCYVTGIGYYSAQTMLHSLIDHVSKGGNLLLNISPMADGTIPSAQQEILLGIGDYLGNFGESIYATRIWSTYGEGPTAMGGGSFAGPRAGTPQDIRFTRNKGNNALYVTALGWQGATLTVKSLNSNQFSISTLHYAHLLGPDGKLIPLPKPTQDTSGLYFSMPSANPPFTALAYVVKLTFEGQIPAWSPPTYVSLSAGFDNPGISDDSNTGTGNLDGNGYSLSAQALAAAGVTPGSAVTAGGLSFTWPSAAPGTPDNVVADGRAIDISGTGPALGFLLTGTFGTASGTGTVYYTDGSTQTFTLSVPDWYTTPPPAGTDAVINMAYRNTPTGQDQHPVYVYYAGVPLTQGKTVQKVALPEISQVPLSNGTNAMHVFAMSIG